MAALSEKLHAGGFIVSEANGFRSREPITIEANEVLDAGTVLGRKVFGAAAAEAAAVAGNTGTGAMTLANPATGAGVKAGVYRVFCIEPAADAGTFQVEDPDGIVVGTAKVGVAFTGVVKFSIADATDFVAGDAFTITVTKVAGNLRHVAWDPEGTDGRELVAGVLFAPVDATGAAKPGVNFARDGEVRASDLTWPDPENAGEVAAGIAGLAKLGVIAR